MHAYFFETNTKTHTDTNTNINILHLYASVINSMYLSQRRRRKNCALVLLKGFLLLHFHIIITIIIIIPNLFITSAIPCLTSINLWWRLSQTCLSDIYLFIDPFPFFFLFWWWVNNFLKGKYLLSLTNHIFSHTFYMKFFY